MHEGFTLISLRKTIKKPEIWISLLALLVGIIALILSWQANRISLQAISPNIVVLDTNRGGSGSKPMSGCYRIWCITSVRLVNLGGAPTSIVSYTATYSYLDSKVTYEGTGWETIYGVYIPSQAQSITSRFIKSSLVSEYANKPIDPGYHMGDDYLSFPPYRESLPLKISEYEVVDIAILNWFTTDLGEGDFSAGNPDGSFFPLEIIYEFELSNGKVIKIPKSTCVYMKTITNN